MALGPLAGDGGQEHTWVTSPGGWGADREGPEDMALQSSHEEIAVHLATARRRRAERDVARAGRRERGWAVARRAAALLRREYGVVRVVVFGSLLRPDAFHERSDVDLAVCGLPGERYFQAVAAVNDLPDAFGVDLVDLDRCRPDLRQAIEREGVAV